MRNIRDITESDVKKYYDKNTKWFLRLGTQKQTPYLHQAIWADGVNNLEDALNYAHHLILEQVPTHLHEQIQLLDLGCGVGGSIRYLAQNSAKSVNLTGVTISSAQKQMAETMFRRLDLEARCKVQEASFQQLPLGIKPVHLAYAIEAFVHSTSVSEFFEQVSHVLAPGGKLVLIDDFLSRQSESSNQANETIKTFMTGWHLGSLLAPKMVETNAKKVGLRLIQNQDLTPFLDLKRPRDRFIQFYVGIMYPFLKSSTYFKSLVGGNARYLCLKKDWIKYRILVFEKV